MISKNKSSIPNGPMHNNASSTCEIWTSFLPLSSYFFLKAYSLIDLLVG